MAAVADVEAAAGAPHEAGAVVVEGVADVADGDGKH